MLRYVTGLGAVTPRGQRSRPRRPALFVDRDGVLNERIPDGYVLGVDELRPLPGALAALDAARRADAALVVVTNQGAIGRGLLAEGTLLAIHGALVSHLARAGIQLDGIYACPHHPRAPDPALQHCHCRKPAPGLLIQAAADLGLDLPRSLMIGDQPSDRAAARAAGIPPGAALTFDGSNGAELARTVEDHLTAG